MLLAIAASIELLFGAYCVLAFIAWTARIYLFTAGKAEFSPVLIVWAALAAGSFWLYSKTMEKIHEMESIDEKAMKMDRAIHIEPPEELSQPGADNEASPTLKS